MFVMPRMSRFMKALLGAVLGSYVLGLVLENWVGIQVFERAALLPGVFDAWFPLRLVAHPLVEHPQMSSPISVLLNLLFLWWTAGPFEARYGTKRTLQLLAVAQAFAAAAATVASFVVAPKIPLFGVHPWIGACIAAFVSTMPKDAPVSFFGVIPMKVVHLWALLVGLPVLSLLQTRDFISFVATLASIAAGVLFMRWRTLLRRGGGRPKRPSKPKASGGFRVIQGGGSDGPPKYLN